MVVAKMRLLTQEHNQKVIENQATEHKVEVLANQKKPKTDVSSHDSNLYE